MNSVAGQRLLDSIPELFRADPIILALFDAVGTELDLVDAATEEMVDARFIETASEWALERWETELRLPVDPTISIDDRRARIITLSRLASRTATIMNIQDLLSRWSKGEAVVTHDPPTYSVDIEFVDLGGVPDDLAFIETIMRKVIPAHLVITYSFNWFTWDESDEVRAPGPDTWTQLDARALTWDANDVFA